MKKVVSFSGGRTSAYLCHLMKEKHGDDVDFVFMCTGAEHAKTYEFIRKVNDEFNLDLTCLRTDFDTPIGKGNRYHEVSIDEIGPDLKPFREMMAKYGVPYIGGMFCTDRMKLVPFTKYCNDKYGKGGYETWLGIRADEPNRYLGDKFVKAYKCVEDHIDWIDFAYMFRAMVDNDGDPRGEVDIFNGMWPEPSEYHKANFDNEWQRVVDLLESAYFHKSKNDLHYMCEISDFGKEDVLDFWSKMPFDLDIHEWLGNCVFCPKKSNLKLAAAQRDEPGFYHEYLTELYSPSVRHDSKTGHWSKMYRGKQSLQDLIATFDGSTGEEIKSRLRGAKMTDAGSCSESCEVFVCEANQMDMFL